MYVGSYALFFIKLTSMPNLSDNNNKAPTLVYDTWMCVLFSMTYIIEVVNVEPSANSLKHLNTFLDYEFTCNNNIKVM